MGLHVERGRTLARSQALQLLFQAEVLDQAVDEVLAGEYLLSKGPLDSYAVELARGCYAVRDAIDAKLEAASENWTLARMPGTDRNLLRLAVYEMTSVEDLPSVAVAINEAVEIAKAYGTDESARFVNGVLGRIARDKTGLTTAAVEQAAADAAAQAAGEAPEAEPVVLDETEA